MGTDAMRCHPWERREPVPVHVGDPGRFCACKAGEVSASTFARMDVRRAHGCPHGHLLGAHFTAWATRTGSGSEAALWRAPQQNQSRKGQGHGTSGRPLRALRCGATPYTRALNCKLSQGKETIAEPTVDWRLGTGNWGLGVMGPIHRLFARL